MKEILEIVLERNKERKLLTKEDMKRICEIVIGLKNLTNVKNVVFHKVSSEYEKRGGCFDGKRIVFYLKGMEDFIAEEYNNMSILRDIDGPSVDAYNFLYLSILFHELTHARQDMVVKKGKNTLETKLFSISNKLLDLPHDFYMDNYVNFPDEVNAFSEGSINAFSVYSKIPKDYLTENDYCHYAEYALSQLVRFYDVDCQGEDVLSPSERMLINANIYNLTIFDVNIQEFTKLVTEPNQESLYQRLTLGLPIDYMDYAYINLLQTGLQLNQKTTFIKKLEKKRPISS